MPERPSFFTKVAAAVTNVVGFTTGAVLNSTSFLRPGVQRKRSTYTYGHAAHDGKPLRLDVYHPDGYGPEDGTYNGEPKPIIFWIHGGGWEVGYRGFIAPGILSQLDRGYAIVSPSYSFLHEAKWPAQLDEIDTAIDWLVDQAGWLGLDADRLVVAGESAGGHLASMAVLDGRCHPRIRGVLAYYPPTDLNALAAGTPFQKLALSYFTGFRGEDAQESARQASPITHVSADAPPFHLLHGTWDEVVPVDQSIRFHEAMVAVGARSTLEVLDRFVHIDPRFNLANRMVAAEEFLDTTTARPTGTETASGISAADARPAEPALERPQRPLRHPIRTARHRIKQRRQRRQRL